MAETQNKEIDSLIKEHVANAVLVQKIGMDIIYCLPASTDDGSSQTKKFPVLFDELDSKMNRLGIDSYGVSDTTLEEVCDLLLSDQICLTLFFGLDLS